VTYSDLIEFLNVILPKECEGVVCVTIIEPGLNYYKVEVCCKEDTSLPFKFMLNDKLEKLMRFFGLHFDSLHIKIIYVD
jgi:hypothetical protein